MNQGSWGVTKGKFGHSRLHMIRDSITWENQQGRLAQAGIANEGFHKDEDI